MSKTHVRLDFVEDNPYQSRIDTGDIEALAVKVADHGLRQLPEGRLLVEGEQPSSYSKWTETYNGEWVLPGDQRRVAELATGHRRVLAVQLLNDDDTVTETDLEKVGLIPGFVPIDLQRLTDDEMLDLLTIENAAREELTAIEQARLIRQHREAGRSNSEIAEVFGRSDSWVSNRKRLLNYPQRIQTHIHEGDLSVRQATALEPIFEADWEDVGLPEGNSFHPQSIFEKALAGRSSEDLRRDVTQFESWMRQLSGETQEEIREQEYEKELESDPESDGHTPAESQPGDVHESDNSGTSTEGAPSTNDRGSPDQERGTLRRDEDRAREESDNGQRNRSSGPPAPVSGDGAPTQIDKEVGDLIGEVADQVAQQIDDDVLTRHLIVLGLGRPKDIQERVFEQLSANLQNEVSSPQTALEEIRQELDDLGYEDIEAPQLRSPDVGHVDPDQVDVLLAPGEDIWDGGAAAGASIASLYVAYRVAEKRMERWRREEIAQEMRSRQERVTEEDFPDPVWEDVQGEIERRLDPQAA